ncbi:hypothetical protein FRC08_017641 [Ceratobasidium sp. 394]|nr:hypothetical protein FRC08_017641 [Ceratobasidium sp. 394]
MKKEDILPHARELLLKEFPLSLRLMGLRLTNLKDLRESDDSGLKRFWASGDVKSSKATEKLPLERDDVDTDDELGLWEVDPYGEPITPSRQITSEPGDPGPSTMAGPSLGTSKGATLKQSKLPVSRASVPLGRSTPSKRKRSASVGAPPSIINVDMDTRHKKARRESIPASGPAVIDVDSVCPNCLQEIDSEERHAENCSPILQSSRAKLRTSGSVKQIKLAPLFCRKRK